MTRKELCHHIYKISHLTGEFKLRSGKTSNEYFDKYRFESQPILLRNIAVQMSEMIPSGTEVLAGLEMGGIPIATAISLETGLPVVFVRKEAKDYGTCQLAEGFDVSQKIVCVIEDVITTGGQVVKSTQELRKRGANVDHVLCVINRSNGELDQLHEIDITTQSLFTMKELKDCENYKK